MPFDSKGRDTVLEILSRLKDRPGVLLPVLHAIQDALGYVPASSVPLIAEGLNVWRRRLPLKPPRETPKSESCATARAACAGSSRSSRSRPRLAASRTVR